MVEFLLHICYMFVCYMFLLHAFSGDDQLAIASENVDVVKQLDDERRERIAQIRPVKVCITGVTSNPASSEFLGCLARGETLGPDTNVHVRLFESDENLQDANETRLETIDIAGPVLLDTVVTSDLELAFADCAFVIITADELERDPDEPKSEFLVRISRHFEKYVHAIEGVAKPDVRVAVVGMQSSLVNFVADAMLKCSMTLGADQIVAVSQLVENRAKGVIANRLKINSLGVENIVVWGSVNGYHAIDTTRARLYDYDGAIWGARPFSVSLEEMVHDDEWLNNEFTQYAYYLLL